MRTDALPRTITLAHRRGMRFCAFIAAAMLLVTAAPAPAAEAPFEPRLMRLAEVLGSLHYLRNLCGEKGNRWRAQMEKLLEVEKPDDKRRARFIASFNR